jgi:membrane protease YdiL (CAAX protease family)
MQALTKHEAVATGYGLVGPSVSLDFDRNVLILGLIYAIWISPFIGGVRGWPCTIGWLVPPAIWLWRTGDAQALGLRLPGPHRFRNLTLALAAGLLCGFGFFALGSLFPMVTQFTLALPALHRSADYGNVKLFIALIPVGHFVHEIFYRGFLQGRFTVRWKSPWPAILLSALLYAWTHVFIFSSQEFQAIMTTIMGGAAGVANVQRTLAAVVGFSMVESVGAGIAAHFTKSVWPAIAFRVTNLVTVVLLVYPRFGLI